MTVLVLVEAPLEVGDVDEGVSEIVVGGTVVTVDVEVDVETDVLAALAGFGHPCRRCACPDSAELWPPRSAALLSSTIDEPWEQHGADSR